MDTVATRHPRLRRIGPALVLLVCLAGTSGPSRADATRQEQYRQWLHSLETTSGARQEADLPPGGSLYPFGQERQLLQKPSPYRYLSISRALHLMEQAGREGGPAPESAFQALARARSHASLGEFEPSLEWYEIAAQRDTAHTYTLDIARESLAAAIALDDSVAVLRRLVNTIGASRIAGRQDEYLLACRYLLAERDRTQLALLVQKLEGQNESLDGRLRFWLAFSLVELGRGADALAQLERLLAGGGLSQGLDERERAWVLTAVPDLLAATGRRDEAACLYGILGGSELAAAQVWGSFMTAQLDLAAGRYGRAAEAFRQLCERRDAGRAGSRACELLPLAEQLGQLKEEGEPYGAAVFYER
jgi:hypothetical protein